MSWAAAIAIAQAAGVVAPQFIALANGMQQDLDRGREPNLENVLNTLNRIRANNARIQDIAGKDAPDIPGL